jgi:hypothetical protein
MGFRIEFAKTLGEKISARRKNFVLLCRSVGFEKLIHHGNRAGHKRRIPQYTKSSISEQVNAVLNRRPQASRRDAAAGISYYVSSEHNTFP